MDNFFKTYFSSPVINYLGRIKERRVFSKPPVFIGGCGRSGTSLLLSILSAHPKIFAVPHETDAFTQWRNAEPGGKRGSSAYPLREDRLYRYLMTHHVPAEAWRWCEKRPYNVLYIKEILCYWPDSRFINIIRDARDVLTSCHPKRSDRYWIAPSRWIRDVSAGLKFKDHPHVLTIRYEDLISDSDLIIKQICDFINEACVPEILHWYENAAVRKNRAWFGGLQPIHSGSVKKWERPEYNSRIESIMKNAQIVKLLKELNYLSG